MQFYIKTIQFFDGKGEPKKNPILTEQVFGNFDEFRLYDTTHIHYEDKVYYFKRIFIEPDDEFNEVSKNIESLDLADQ